MEAQREDDNDQNLEKKTPAIIKRQREENDNDQHLEKKTKVEEESIVPEVSKKRSLIEIAPIKIADFSFTQVRILQDGDFLKFVLPNGEPLFLELNPNGTIPRKIGIKKDDNGNLKICMNIESEEDQKHLRRLSEEWKAISLIHNEAWRIAARKPLGWVAKFAALLPEVKPKPNQTKKFAPLFNANFSEDDFNARKLRFRNREDQTLVRNQDEIKGSRCLRFIFEFGGAILGGLDKKGEEKQGGFIKKAKSGIIEKNTDYYEYVHPQDQFTHDVNCQCKHIMPLDLRSFDFERDADLQPLVFTDPTKPNVHRVPSGRIVLKGTDCPLYLRANGGGTYPKFCTSYNHQFKSLSEQFTVNDEEERTALKNMELWLKKKSVEMRDTWFPNARREIIEEDGGIADKTVRYWVKGILGLPAMKKDKDKKVIEGQFWAPNAKLSLDQNDFKEPFFHETETYQNDKGEVFPVRLYHLKDDSHARYYDVDGNRISDLSTLANATWQTKDFHVRNVYLQKDKTKYSATIINTQLGHSRDDYIPKEDDDYTTTKEETLLNVPNQDSI